MDPTISGRSVRISAGSGVRGGAGGEGLACSIPFGAPEQQCWASSPAQDHDDPSLDHFRKAAHNEYRVSSIGSAPSCIRLGANVAYVWAAIIGGVLVSAALADASGDQPILVGVLGGALGLLGLFAWRVIRGSPPPKPRPAGSRVLHDSLPSLPKAEPGQPSIHQAGSDRELRLLIALTDRLAPLFPGWDARVTQLGDSTRGVQIDHFPGASTVLFVLVDGQWIAMAFVLDPSGEPLPGTGGPTPLGTSQIELDETVVRIVRAEVDAYRRVAQPQSSPHASGEVSQMMRTHAAQALRSLAPNG